MRTVFLIGAAIALAVARPAAEVTAWPRVNIDDIYISTTLVWGLEGAAAWLKKPECRGLFTEFRDQSGRPLKEKLDELRMGEAEYLRLVKFVDGSMRTACRRQLTVMFTAPGSRVVFVCTDQFRRGVQQDPRMKAALVLHEAMHTLGLGENPPTSAHITNRIVSRCY
jgi:hypothetical protein